MQYSTGTIHFVSVFAPINYSNDQNILLLPESKNQMDRKNLIEMIDPKIQDYVEYRLQSHTESSMAIVAGFSKQLKELTDIIQTHDRVLSGENIETLLEIIKTSREDKIFKAKSTKLAGKIAATGGWVVGIATFIGACTLIWNSLSAHIKF